MPTPTDLPTRLRFVHGIVDSYQDKGPENYGWQSSELSDGLAAILEAADTIERLQAENQALRELAFQAGWRTAANWLNRDDLIADIGSPAYIADRDAALKDHP